MPAGNATVRKGDVHYSKKQPGILISQGRKEKREAANATKSL